MTRKQFVKLERAKDLLELIHSDICGPLNVKTYRGMEYLITFTDDYSRYGYIYLIKKQVRCTTKIYRIQGRGRNQLGRKIKLVRTDQGGAYMSDIFETFCKENRIIHQLTISYTPQQNGVAERRNRTLIDMVRSMLSNANLSSTFWGEALD